MSFNYKNYVSANLVKFVQFSLVLIFIFVFFNFLNVIQQLLTLNVSVSFFLSQLFLILLLLPLFYIGLIVLAQYFLIKDYFLAFFKSSLQIFLYIYSFTFIAFIFVFFNFIYVQIIIN